MDVDRAVGTQRGAESEKLGSGGDPAKVCSAGPSIRSEICEQCGVAVEIGRLIE